LEQDGAIDDHPIASTPCRSSAPTPACGPSVTLALLELAGALAKHRAVAVLLDAALRGSTGWRSRGPDARRPR
jgi:hypothetical protein